MGFVCCCGIFCGSSVDMLVQFQFSVWLMMENSCMFVLCIGGLFLYMCVIWFMQVRFSLLNQVGRLFDLKMLMWMKEFEQVLIQCVINFLVCFVLGVIIGLIMWLWLKWCISVKFSILLLWFSVMFLEIFSRVSSNLLWFMLVVCVFSFSR